jgi:hypothetical protein
VLAKLDSLVSRVPEAVTYDGNLRAPNVSAGVGLTVVLRFLQLPSALQHAQPVGAGIAVLRGPRVLLTELGSFRHKHHTKRVRIRQSYDG